MTIKIVLSYLVCFFESIVTFYLLAKLLIFRYKGKNAIFMLMISVLVYSLLIYGVQSINPILKLCLFISFLEINTTIFFKDNVLIKSFFVILIQYELIITDLLVGNLLAFLSNETAVDIFNNSIFYSLIAKIFNLFFVLITIKVFKALYFNISKKYWLFLNLITIIFLIITVCFIMVYPTLDINTKDSGYFFVLSVCFLFMSCLVIYFFSKICQFFQKEKQLYISEMTNKALQEQLILQENMSDNIKKMKHDMKNNLLNISLLLSEQKYNDVSKYIFELNSNFELAANIPSSGNSVIDAIISCKAMAAEKNNIQLIQEIEKLPPINIPYTALASILSNLLDNAIEALINAEDDKRVIYLKISDFKNYIVIIVKNYYSNILETENNIIRTTKSDASLHGYGLKLIQEAVAQNGGHFTFTTENNEFVANVLLSIK